MASKFGLMPSRPPKSKDKKHLPMAIQNKAIIKKSQTSKGQVGQKSTDTRTETDERPEIGIGISRAAATQAQQLLRAMRPRRADRASPAGDAALADQLLLSALPPRYADGHGVAGWLRH
jgi:hypothetical protein